MRSKTLMRCDRTHRDRRDYGARRFIVLPVIAHTAHLAGADWGFILRIEDQRHDFAVMIGKTPGFVVGILEFKIGRKAADGGSGSWFCSAHSGQMPPRGGSPFLIGCAPFSTPQKRKATTLRRSDRFFPLRTIAVSRPSGRAASCLPDLPSLTVGLLL